MSDATSFLLQSLLQGGASPQMVINYAKNQPYVKKGQDDYTTKLPEKQETKFREWVKTNNIPFDPDATVTDYDMRGFYRAYQAGDPIAKNAVDPNDGKMHYPDYWKTPYHQTFSAESQWADPKTAPTWNDKDQLVAPDGTVLYDDRAANTNSQLIKALQQ